MSVDIKLNISNAIKAFSTDSLFQNAINLFTTLGYKTERQLRLRKNTYQGFIDEFDLQDKKLNEKKLLADRWEKIELLFQLTQAEMTRQSFLFDSGKVDDTIIEAYLFFAIELKEHKLHDYTRTELSEITRELNKFFSMPVMVLFLHGKQLTLSVIKRRLNKRDAARDVLEKVTLIKDISITNPHRAHVEILYDLSFDKLQADYEVNNFVELHNAWQKTLDTKELNNKFFRELSNWFFWAMENVSFPDDLENKKEVRNATNLIRLITRVIFIWFIKEKQLVPASLFRKDFIASILKDFNKNNKSQNYYNAILQNLFFGTLNQKMELRKFAKDGDFNTNKDEFDVKNLYRYGVLFLISENEALKLFETVPFLNGGLFDCLDREKDYVDGFSRNPKKRALVPDYLFFGEEKEVDLNEVYGTRNKRYSTRGLISLLENYKFTIAENTPIEEEIALDPELLGKVFENLLASYNPETQTTARKQTGSFYTPREIVNYMVDESLLEYIKQNVKNESKDFETRLRDVFSYSENPNPFSEAETKELIGAINKCKILDPACGSGAFPMGVLHKMVHILQKLDPENKLWKDLQRKKAIAETEAAFKIGDKEERAKRLAEINDVFENNASDYGRKLYLIENCIYGIDIQPIAVQIAKLRFFISLVIDQKVNKTKENFGVRSLPNLETKFVAANTLIGLDKPQQTLLRNPDIEGKENELKELRHKYFTANTRKEKIALQKHDKKLRLEIAKMLESDGWETNVAKQIVAFDPYDQNTFANWFDPEWMFGITSGFDILIGNPPYVQVSKGLFSEILFPYSEGKDKGKQNLYKVFVEGSYNLAKSNAVSCMIVQSSLLCDLSSTYTRELLIKNTQILKIIEYPKNTTNENARVFESVLQGTCTYLFKKSRPHNNYNLSISINNDISTINNLTFEHLNQLSILKLYPDTYYIPLIRKNEAEILRKISLCSIPFGTLMTSINQGDLNLTSNASKFSEKRTSVKLYRGRNVHRYLLIREVNDYVNPGFLSEKVEDNQKHTYIVLQEITGTTDKHRLHSCLTDKSEKFLFGHTANKILIKDSKLNKACVAILNSSLLDWLFRKTSTNNHVMGYELKQLPIPNQLNKFSEVLSILTDYVSFQKQNNLDTSFFERLINALVYELYLNEEITTGGAIISIHLTNLKKLEEGEDERNLKSIEKLIKELSDPKHPISASLLKLLTIEEVKIIEGRK